MKSIIESIYSEACSQAEKILPKSEEYQELHKKVLSSGMELRNTFTDKQTELFEKYLYAEYRASALENAEHFREGVSFGVRLTAESFIEGN